MKQTPLIFQDFSIAGLRKQWEYQQYQAGKLPASTEFYTINGFDAIGCKTETRRTRGLDKINENPNEWRLMTHSKPFDIKPDEYFFVKNEPYTEVLIKCPYGKIGDEIWVKESYKPLVTGGPKGFNLYDYKADVGSKGMADDIINGWKSPMFMPKAASRIKLEITGISIERLRDITEEGAIREGVYQLESGMWLSNGGNSIKDTCKGSDPLYAYKMVWWLLHGQESWNKSPWVWVIKFTVKEFKL